MEAIKTLDEKKDALAILILVVVHLAYSLLSWWASKKDVPVLEPLLGKWWVSVVVCILLVVFAVDLHLRVQ